MAGLILNPLPKIKHPYYVSKLGLHLYSAEELCYYIYNNIMLIDDSFIDEHLLEFLCECGYEDTVLKIQKWYENADVFEMLIVILQDVHYYSAIEIEQFREECARISREGLESVAFEKANYLNGLGKYYDAISLYDDLINGNSEFVRSKELAAKVYYSKGIALARLFAYNDAIDCFVKAYELDHNENYIKKAYMVHLVSPKTKFSEDVFSEIKPEKLGSWKKEFDDCASETRYGATMYEIDELLKKDARKRQAGFLDLIATWRSDYKRCQS